jgi:hypothetical protein
MPGKLKEVLAANPSIVSRVALTQAAERGQIGHDRSTLECGRAISGFFGTCQVIADVGFCILRSLVIVGATGGFLILFYNYIYKSHKISYVKYAMYSRVLVCLSREYYVK